MLNILSQCLLNSFKYKTKEDIKTLLEQNIVNIEKIIQKNYINDNIIKIIFSLEKKIYKQNNRRFL